jgi:predicted transcriptional regulator
MSKKFHNYAETLYHLINFRLSQYKQSKSMLKMDYDSFMIVSCIGAHALKNSINIKNDWESVWEITRSKNHDKFYNKKKLTIFALANLIGLPTETVRRKIVKLKKKKLISNNSKLGLVPTEKIEELMKSYALNEVDELSSFLKSLDKHGSLDVLLDKKYKTLG